MLKQRKPLKVTTDKTARIPAVRVLIAIAVIYALLKTIELHPLLGGVYALLAVLVFFHFRRRRKLEAAGVEMPSPYAADRFKPNSNSEADTSEKGDAIDAEYAEVNETATTDVAEEKSTKKVLPKRLDKSECRH